MGKVSWIDLSRTAETGKGFILTTSGNGTMVTRPEVALSI